MKKKEDFRFYPRERIKKVLSEIEHKDIEHKEEEKITKKTKKKDK